MTVINPSQTNSDYTVAIMQPYFFPYAGYYRLLAKSNLFVIYDCVQFPRRGWVHRNKLLDNNGIEQWITLPLVKAPQDVLIQDLRFPADASGIMAERLRSFPIASGHPTLAAEMMSVVLNTQGSVVDYLGETLMYVALHLGLPWAVIRSSTLKVPDTFRGQDRIIEIARRVGARRYINPPGGRDLYDSAAFADAGMTLEFLPSYPGPHGSILGRILDEDRNALKQDILSSCR